jgi:hypothetical protein
MKKATLLFLLTLPALATAACDKSLAFGDPNAVIVAAPPDWWPELQDTVFAVLAPDVFTLRNERTFRLNYDDPTSPDWELKRKFREEIVIGSREHPWMVEALAAVDDTVTIAVPGIYEAEEVWARRQRVTLVLVDPAGDVKEQVLPLVEEAHRRLERRFRQGVRERMFMSGENLALADSLLRTAGFALLLPEVYGGGSQDSLYWFRNDNPSPGDLIRQVAVTWRTPIPGELPVDSLVAWKEAVSRTSYNVAQVVDRASLRSRSLALGDMRVFEVRGAWLNPPESSWPAAGPFILWSLACPAQSRLYLLDAWVYAPGEDKWEYILQIEAILDSFRCGR